MKNQGRMLFLAILIMALTGVMAIGKDKVKRESITFPSNVTVNGTVVKAGDYDLRFDEETGELQILKHGKVVAKTTGRLTPRTDKSHETKMTMKDDALVSISFGSDEIVIGPASGSSD